MINKDFIIEKKNNEFWIRNSSGTLVRIFKTIPKCKTFINQRVNTMKQSKGKSIFGKGIIKELNKIAKEI